MLSSIQHLTLTVSDLSASQKWYSEVLGFEIVREACGDELSKTMMRNGDITLILVEHHSEGVHDSFSEFRVGLDHLSFAVQDRESLEKWATHLDAYQVPRSEIAQGALGSVLSFRDPDNIALEFYSG